MNGIYQVTPLAKTHRTREDRWACRCLRDARSTPPAKMS